MAEEFHLPEVERRDSHIQYFGNGDLETLPNGSKSVPERTESVSGRAKKQWRTVKMKMKLVNKFKHAREHARNRRLDRERRECSHRELLDRFRTRLKDGDPLMQKTASMGFNVVYDSLVKWVYNPSGTLRITMDSISFFCILFSWFCGLFSFAFTPHLIYPSVSVLIYFTEIFYFMDMLHLSAIIIHSQNVSMEKYSVADKEKLKKYVSFLFFDFIASIPLNLLGLDMCGRNSRYVCGLLQTFKAIKLLSILEDIEEHMTAHEDSKRNLSYKRISRLLKLLASCYLVVHFLCCTWFFFNTLEPDHLNWFKVDHYADSVSVTFEDVPTGSLYAKSFYTTLLMIIGDGIRPQSSLQFIYASVLMMVGIVVIAIIIGEVTVLVQKFSHAKTQYELKVERVAECMGNLNLPQDLQNRVQEYYKFMWDAHRTTDAKPAPFLKDLSPALRDEVDLYLKRQLLDKTELFRDAPLHYLRELVRCLVHAIYLRGDFIMREGEKGEEMFFIAEGSCLVSLKGKRLAIMERGSNFGEIAMVSSMDRTASVHAITNVTLYVLHKSSVDFLEHQFHGVLKESIGKYLDKHNLVFSTSPEHSKQRQESGIEFRIDHKYSKQKSSLPGQENVDSPTFKPVYSPTSNSKPEHIFRVGKPNMAMFRRRSPTHWVSEKELSNTGTHDHLVDKKSMSTNDLNVPIQNAVNRQIKTMNSSPLIACNTQIQPPKDKENHPETETFAEEKRHQPKEAFDPVAWREKKLFQKRLEMRRGPNMYAVWNAKADKSVESSKTKNDEY